MAATASAINYSLPGAANYHTPAPRAFSSSPPQKTRGYRVCDQCGAIETPTKRFRLCGGCMTTQYCSPDCQKIHWPSHKPICQHTQTQLSTPPPTPTDPNLAKNLRKFTSAHADLLGWAGFQALQLKRIPANVRQNALLIELRYQPPSAGDMEAHRRFSIASTHIVPRTYIPDQLVLADIARREERCRRAGGIGTLVVILQCGDISQVMPVEVDPPAKITWDERQDWAQVLVWFVSQGRTDFKPISTTRSGIVYG
ncbi:hypothetical protein AX15_000559 [Amanita polypyramis BW_CC]|nr:hypothetical protein AX15_000559 [Amanita polypyramis BW_CC]